MARLIVQLFNDDIGNVTLDQNQPGGLDAFTVEQRRGKKSSAITYEFTVNLQFYKEGKKFVKDVFDKNGPDGVVNINIYSENPNTYGWDIEYQGSLQLDNYDESEEFITTNVTPVGFQRKFLNLEKRMVDMDSTVSRLGVGIGSSNPITLPLAPKTIQKSAFLKGEGKWVESGFTPNFPSVIRLGGDLNGSDFEDTFLDRDAWITTTDIPSTVKNFIQDVKEAGSYRFDLSKFKFDLFIEVTIFFPGTIDLSSWSILFRYQKNEGAITELYTRNLLPGDFDLNFNTNSSVTKHYDNIEQMLSKQNEQILDGEYIAIQEQRRFTFDGDETATLADYTELPMYDANPSGGTPGNRWRYYIYDQVLDGGVTEIVENFEVDDEVYFWFDSDVDFVGPGTNEKNVAYRFNDDFEFKYTAATIFPETTTKAYLIYEFLEQIVKSLTDQPDCFRSEYFGRTDTSFAYPEDGPGSMLAISNGRSIRQLENQTTFGNWDEAFESVNALHCLGWSFETLDSGLLVVRCEPRSYFFNKNLKAIEFNSISNLHKTIEIDLLYSEVKFGYPQVENINQVNGIDEFNSQRIINSPLANVTTVLDIRSLYRASGLEIESQRRQIGKTEDSKLDDENFFISVVRNGSSYRVRQGADFESVTGVFDPDTAYNIDISPGRNIRRWGEVLASNVIYSDNKSFEFTFGDYNYLMSSKEVGEDEIFENSNLDLTDVEALYYPEQYVFDAKMSFLERTLVNQGLNGYAFANVSWLDIPVEGYFMRIKSTIADRKGDLRILRVYRKPVNL